MDVDVPKSVWAKSGRPIQGRVSRLMFGSTFLLIGLSLPWPNIGIPLMVVGVVGFFVIPIVTDLLVQRREPAILAASKDDAARLLEDLDRAVLVSAFAPDAWVTLQRGRLFLALGDGRAAANAFATTARVLDQPDMPVLVSAQARALLMADDRAGAREHLMALSDAGKLSPRDHLDLGVIMLGEAARAEQAKEHLESAHEGLDGHPQAAAALATALARTEEPAQVERAAELLERAEAEVDDADEWAQGLVKRARKAVRAAKDAAKKKKRKR